MGVDILPELGGEQTERGREHWHWRAEAAAPASPSARAGRGPSIPSPLGVERDSRTHPLTLTHLLFIVPPPPPPPFPDMGGSVEPSPAKKGSSAIAGRPFQSGIDPRDGAPAPNHSREREDPVGEEKITKKQ